MSPRTTLSTTVGILLLATQISTANAIVVTLDTPSPTVIRPLSGATEVNFTGRIQLSEGFEPGMIQASTLFNESGDQLDGLFPMPRFDSGTFNTAGVLFSVLASATDTLGRYRFGDFALATPIFIRYFECPVGSISGCNSTTVNYSLNLVSRAGAPEPAGLALLGVGLLGFGMARRRRARRLR